MRMRPRSPCGPRSRTGCHPRSSSDSGSWSSSSAAAIFPWAAWARVRASSSPGSSGFSSGVVMRLLQWVSGPASAARWAGGCAVAGTPPGRAAGRGRGRRRAPKHRPGTWRPSWRRPRSWRGSAPARQHRSPAPGRGRPSGPCATDVGETLRRRARRRCVGGYGSPDAPSGAWRGPGHSALRRQGGPARTGARAFCAPNHWIRRGQGEHRLNLY